MEFVERLHAQLEQKLRNNASVRSMVDKLLPTNPFPESCFCKGCVLPIVDSCATEFLTARCGVNQFSVYHALRCEGYASPMYACSSDQVGFSSHSRSNSYHPGDKSGRRASSRRSPDFCIRHPSLRMVGEVKYVPREKSTAKLAHELRDYLSIRSEPTSDWGHDFGYGLLYMYGGSGVVQVELVRDRWEQERFLISVFH